jgi:thiol-disulfide isomerase/thioredoxin
MNEKDVLPKGRLKRERFKRTGKPMMKSVNNFYRKIKTAGFFFIMAVAAAMTAAPIGCRSLPKSGTVPAPENLGGATGQDTDGPFPTFATTGLDPCTDDDGRPLILLFSASSCSHCKWVGGVFDLIAGEYADQGLVAAHHYDVETGDDLLTEGVENRIPKAHLAIGRRGDPDGYMPYFNFGCRYDRIGTGYEKQDDLAAEADEMRRVIEALLP